MKMFKPLVLVVLFALSMVATAQQSIVLKWSASTERENGQPLSIEEIGGYELRYTLAGSSVSQSVLIPDGGATSYEFKDIPVGSHSFEIAVFDTDGLYSDFVSINYATNGKPGAPPAFSVERVGNDVIAACMEDPNCRVAVSGEW